MELSGPHPLRRVANIVSKPRIWNRDAMAILLEIHLTFRVTSSGRAVTVPAPALVYASVTLMIDCPAPSVYAMWKLNIAE